MTNLQPKQIKHKDIFLCGKNHEGFFNRQVNSRPADFFFIWISDWGNIKLLFKEAAMSLNLKDLGLNKESAFKIKKIMKAEFPLYFSDAQFTLYAITEKIERWEADHGAIELPQPKGSQSA